MVPIKYGSTSHCGTLITNPHIPRGTYFALNFGLEYSDTVEKLGQNFWTNYKSNPNPTATQTVGAYYLNAASAVMIYDNSKLNNFPGSSVFKIRAGAGGTIEPDGLQQNAVYISSGNNYTINQDPGVGPHWSGNSKWNMGGTVSPAVRHRRIYHSQPKRHYHQFFCIFWRLIHIHGSLCDTGNKMQAGRRNAAVGRPVGLCAL
jgi:hypothetical protein